MIHAQIDEIIKSNRSFAITSHTSPDGDSMGSMLALYSILKSIGKNIDLFIDDSLPNKYSFLPYYTEINNKKYNQYDCIFILDCGDLGRIGKIKDILPNCKTIINIDHHITNEMYGDLNFVDDKASSTGELIYKLLEASNYTILKETAICLYTSILTDTGGFKYSNTSSKTLSIVSNLVEFGFDFTEINDIIFNKKSEAQVRLTSKVTSTLDIILNGKAAVLILTKDMLKECNASEEDADEIVNIGRSIDNVDVSVFIKEKTSSMCRVSLRSNKIVDVSKVAAVFDGGGHVRAAGFTYYGTISEVKENVTKELSNWLG